jgi:hypothetical protein
MALATQVAKSGGDLVIVARRKELLSKLQESLSNAYKVNVELLCKDLTLPDDLEEVAARLRVGDTLHLINNAGAGSFGEFTEIDLAHEEFLVKLNVLAPLKLTHAILPILKERREGGIIYIASIASFQPLPYMATYAATKAFDLFHALALREEMQGYGVKVLAACPGPVATEFAGVARVPGTVTGIFREDPNLVATSILHAYFNNRAKVLPGITAKLMYWGIKCVPQTLSTFLTAKKLRPLLSYVRKSTG